MEHHDGEKKPLTIEDCYAHVSDQIFRLRPEQYKQKYPKWPGLVGLELEHQVFYKDVPADGQPIPVPLLSNKHVYIDAAKNAAAAKPALAEALVRVAKKQGWTPNEDASLKAMNFPQSVLNVSLSKNSTEALSFEPGGQLEFSSQPYPCLSEATERLHAVQKILDEALTQENIMLLQTGINPWWTPEQVGLQMPKSRYQAMDKFFSAKSIYGRMMMRLTTTVQVNLDFGGDEETLAKRYLAAQLIAPVMTTMFAYSPIVGGKPTGHLSYRGHIWRGLDVSRTGMVGLSEIAKKLTKISCVAAYIEFLCKSQVVFLTGRQYEVPENGLTFGEWLTDGYKGTKPTKSDLITHLSLLFPEVRPRGFLELRSVDAQARVWQDVPAAVYTALLYEPRALNELLDLALKRLADAPKLLDSCSMGMHVPELAKLATQVFEIALAGFSRLPDCFREGQLDLGMRKYFEHFTARGRSPANDLLEQVGRNRTGKICYADFKKVEETWQSLC